MGNRNLFICSMLGFVIASIMGTMALRTIRQQMNVEAVTDGFRDTFFSISFCFLLAMMPMFFVTRRMTRRDV